MIAFDRTWRGQTDWQWVAAVATAVICVAGCTQRRSAPEPYVPRLEAKSYALNAVCSDYDNQFQGICVASDGNCYFAGSTHSNRHGAGFFRYDPRTGEVKVLCEDITRICDEDPTRMPPQGKIHSDVVECDGWLYFTTHLANYWRPASEIYTGGHLVGYEMATGSFRDFGVVRENYSCYAGIAVDCERKKIYVYVTPFSFIEMKGGGGPHFYRVDIESGAMEDLGLIRSSGDACFYPFLDRKGDCWFTLSDTSGALFRIRADTGRIDRWDNALPLWTEEDVDEEAENRRVLWTDWTQALPGTNRCLLNIHGGNQVWSFDPEKAPDWRKAFQPGPAIGPMNFGAALTSKRLYYVQRANRQSSRNTAKDLHLMSLSLDRWAVTDHGVIFDKDGRRPTRINSLAADENGRVFMVGDWTLLPGEQGSLRFWGQVGKFSFGETGRGQFFAVVDVSEQHQPLPVTDDSGSSVR